MYMRQDIHRLYHDMIETAAHQGIGTFAIPLGQALDFHVVVGHFADGGLRIARNQSQLSTVLLGLLGQNHHGLGVARARNR